MRFKKQIIIICLFTMLFLPFSNIKNVSANPLAIPITIGAKEVITSLILSMGIVLTDNQSHYVMVNEIYKQRYEEVNQIVKEIETGNRFSLLKEMEKFAETIKEVYNMTYDDTFTEKGYKYTKPITITKGATTSIKPGDSFAIPEGVTGKIFVYEGGKYVTALTLNGQATDFSLGLSKLSSTATNVLVYGNGGVSSFKLYKEISQCSLSVMFDVASDFISECSLTLNPDWDIFKEKNKDVTDSSIGASASALADGSICADRTLDWSNEWDYTQEKDYPRDKDYAGDVGITVDDVLDKPSLEETETPTTGDTLWDTLFGWLKTLISPIINLLSAIIDLLSKLLDLLKELLISLFVPKEGYFVDRFSRWKNDFSSKFFVDLSQLEDLKNLNEQGVKDIHFNIMGVDVVLKLSIINRIAEYSRTIAMGVTIIALIWYNYKNVYKLIRGSSPVEGVTGHYGGK